METNAVDGGKAMKGKRIAVLALAAAMTVSLLVLPAGAVSFTDMEGHWAREDVEYLAGLGVINGTRPPDDRLRSAPLLLPYHRRVGCG